MSRNPTCKLCDLTIVGPKVKIKGGWRHPECEKPARHRMPARPLSPDEQDERRFDKRETKRRHGDTR